jgi:ABC-type multidrug transport system ATPase subunit
MSAGKTTLLDVLAGRKNSGIMTGEVFLRGRPKDPATFVRAK